MDIRRLHEWDVTPQEALAIQEALRPSVIREDDLPDVVKRVAGVDVGFEDNGETTRAAVAVLSFPELRVVETAVSRQPTNFPYVPGLLSFREIPAILDVLQQLTTPPDLLLCDGQGIAHQRRLGLASHLGLLADRPSIGVAKSRLVGKHDDVGIKKGSVAPLMHEGEQVGVALRTRTNVRPLYISVGHRISLETAVDYVLACTPKYRLPETTRQAHKLASG